MKYLFVAIQYLLPHHLLSRMASGIAESQSPWLKNALIRNFVRIFKVDMEEAIERDIENYPTFNAFFTRALRSAARPLPEDKNALACPADGTVSQIGRIDAGRMFQAKRHSYSLLDLVGDDPATARLFTDGHFATVYLSPSDYHRVHMPCDGTLRSMTYVPGRLFSVNATTTDAVPNLFTRNERAVCLFDTEHGPMAMILVGAMLVAGIDTVWSGQVTPLLREINTIHYSSAPTVKLRRGEEMGRFRFGSTVILLFPRNTVGWEASLERGSTVRMGQLLGMPGQPQQQERPSNHVFAR